MENKVILISPGELTQFLQPILQRMEKIEAYLYANNARGHPVYSDAEAAEFLKCSKKKLQNLRNAREIGFIRENGGRKILYKHEHLMEYLENHELKKKK